MCVARSLDDLASDNLTAGNMPMFRPVAIRRVVALALVVVASATGPIATARGETCLPCSPSVERPDDQVWLISTRGLRCIDEAAPLNDQLRVEVRNGQDWTDSSWDEFQAAPAETTTILVHGNRFDDYQARQAGLGTYRGLVRRKPAAAPLRFVIWSWPSQKARGAFNDIRVKAARCDVDGYVLGRCLSELRPASQVTLAGFSFGARIAASSMHLVGGGILAGRTLPHAGDSRMHDARRHIRAVLLVPAMDNDWLLPGRRLGNSLTTAEQTLLVYNSRDPALKFYHWMRQARNRALGFTGLAGASRLGQFRDRVEQINVASMIGRTHDWGVYQRNGRILQRLADYTFGDVDVQSTH